MLFLIPQFSTKAIKTPRLEFINKEERAKRIVDWLVEIDVIKPIKSKCVIGLKNMDIQSQMELKKS